ncbi:MAG: NAD(P)/FAD-dependent oxidoreductase [Gemmatimonadales bacterium]|nr:NAD(P)/FAD-dependent oxidoreductase [Gemmatimonadales bacterium]MYG48542.1 NAD(P)/FAD-dependent oxidoreductase [Gemmatimonadales bacterium]MYK02342.1 NAD(P)/FAD-dependent oxidoreductase [Candidatus Palauibacter ramosifaciens]
MTAVGALPESADYDLAVVGAGFAGLACARRAAERGLSVLVLERQSEPGERIHTTGILVKEAWDEWAAPASLVRRIQRVRVYDPRHRFVELERDSYFFMATDTAGLLRHLVDETLRSGAEIRFGAPFEGVVPTSGMTAAPTAAPGATRGSMPLTLAGSGAASGVTCRFLVGADGARSRVAESFALDRNRRLLKGVEWEYEASGGDGDCLHCFIDPECAPGYIGWVVPGVRATQVGLALHRDRRADMRRFSEKIDGLFGLSGRRVLEKRGGVIPIGGRLRNFHADRVLLVGDAAGMVSPLTAGGIHQAYRFGKLAADAIADHLGGSGSDRGAAHPGDVVRRAYPNHTLKRAARWGFDHLPVARALQAGLLSWNVFRRLAETVFFHRSR